MFLDATIKLYDEMVFEEEEFDSIDELILKAFTEQKYDDLLKYTIYVERQINETDARYVENYQFGIIH